MDLSINRLKRELLQPSNRFIKIILDIFYNCIPIVNKNITKHSLPLLIWDIRSNPITFDIVWLLYESFLNFSKIGYKEFDIIIFMPKDFTLKPFKWNNYHKFVDNKELYKRIEKLIIPIAKSFPTVKSITIERDYQGIINSIKTRSYIYPKVYRPKIYYPAPKINFKILLKSLKNSDFKKHAMIKSKKVKSIQIENKTILFKKYITLTLRDYGYSPERNTAQNDINNILDFAELNNFMLVIIPDNINNIKNYKIPESSFISYEARKSISKRVEIYANSELNILPPCGPFYLSMFIENTKTIIYNLSKNWESDKITPRKFKSTYKYGYGDQPYLDLSCYVIWHNKFRVFDVNKIKEAYKILQKLTK